MGNALGGASRRKAEVITNASFFEDTGGCFHYTKSRPMRNPPPEGGLETMRLRRRLPRPDGPRN